MNYIDAAQAALDRAVGIIDTGDNRAMAADGPVSHVRDELSDKEWRDLYLALVEARGALARASEDAAPAEEESGLSPADYWLAFLVLHAEHVHGCTHTGQLRAALDIEARSYLLPIDPLTLQETAPVASGTPAPELPLVAKQVVDILSADAAYRMLPPVAALRRALKVAPVEEEAPSVDAPPAQIGG